MCEANTMNYFIDLCETPDQAAEVRHRRTALENMDLVHDSATKTVVVSVREWPGVAAADHFDKILLVFRKS